MYPRNSATPPRIAIGAVLQISDGAVQGSGVSVAVRTEGGSETAGVGTISYGGSSNVAYYSPTQAETNSTAFVVTAYKTGCIPVSVTIITSAASTSGQVVTDAASRDASKATGFATPTNITAGTITTATNLTNLPAIPANWLTAAGIATGAFTSAKFAAGAFDAVWSVATRTITAISDSAGITTLLTRIAGTIRTSANDVMAETAQTISIQSGLATASQIPANFTDATFSSAGVFAAAALVNGPSGSGPTASVIADAVWDEVLSGHLTAGTTGEALNAAGAAGDPWVTALPGSYGVGSAGNIIGNRIDAAITSRNAVAPNNAGIATALVELGKMPRASAAIAPGAFNFTITAGQTIEVSYTEPV